ncbi:hypothetical protein K432DRAFT_414953 [Lepidopterella palustris CBS 459.81]|uniref:Uncharacterized protein n=1 Tax=Lepidopterella palustris CBS 459.81 TaxID=1314670 RepID=A0A8E2EFS1_9PEZI|nr:hypothetical protein K432DRAFT_414953 [Lepidopterella palustris CBS 459.81]
MSKGGVLPSYEESIGADKTGDSFPSGASKGQQILDQLTMVRAQHISSVIDELISPLVEKQAMYGIADTTIALIPSDVIVPQDETTRSEFDFDNPARVEAVGFTSDGDLQQVQLEGPMNRISFWKQDGIVQDLERVLQDRLNAASKFRAPKPKTQVPEALPPKPSKKGFWGLKSNAAAPSVLISPTDPGLVSEELGGQMQVSAKLEEICLRTVSAFGLYDTITRQGIVIKIRARC